MLSACARLFLKAHDILDDVLIMKYQDVEGEDKILHLMSEGLLYQCVCGKLYERDGGFCSTGVCDDCNVGFCFKCHKRLRLVGALRHAEAHMCDIIQKASSISPKGLNDSGAPKKPVASHMRAQSAG